MPGRAANARGPPVHKFKKKKSVFIGPSVMSLVKLHMSYLLTSEPQHVDGEERKVMTDRRIRRRSRR